MYDYLPYAGSSTFHGVEFDAEEDKLGTSGKFVTVLCRTIPDMPDGLKPEIFVDNFFCSIPLILYLSSKNFETLGTIRKDRLRNCSLKTEQQLKKEGRGSFDYKTGKNAGVTVVRWADNKVVTLASSFMGVEPIDKVQRYDRKENAKIDVPAPAVVKHYNKHMGGVDLADMLISLYRTPLRAKWYYLRIF